MTATVSALPALPMTLRAMLPGDLAYVVSTWACSLTPPPWMARNAYRTNMRAAAQLTMRRAARVVVLASSDHESTILGWACGDDGVVHHAYARPELRQSSAGRAWIDALVHAAMATTGRREQ